MRDSGKDVGEEGEVPPPVAAAGAKVEGPQLFEGAVHQEGGGSGEERDCDDHAGPQPGTRLGVWLGDSYAGADFGGGRGGQLPTPGCSWQYGCLSLASQLLMYKIGEN